MSKRESLSIIYGVIVVLILIALAFNGFLNLSEVKTVFMTLFAGSSLAIITWAFKSRFEEKSQEISEIKVNLRAHYIQIIERMKLWNYVPSESGDMIKMGISDEEVPRLKQDLQHLIEFKKVWNIYSDGSRVVKIFNEADSKARTIIEDYLKTELEKGQLQFYSSSVDWVIKTWSMAIINRIESEIKTNKINDFEIPFSSDIQGVPHFTFGSYSYLGQNLILSQYLII
jgi:hypothetical protein